MTYSYKLIDTPADALVSLAKAWIEDVDDEPRFQEGVLFVLESLAGSLSEIAIEKRTQELREKADRIYRAAEVARERWKSARQEQTD